MERVSSGLKLGEEPFFLHSTVVGVEHTLLDEDSIENHHRRELLCGTFTIYPEDTRFTTGFDPPEVQDKRVLELVQQGIDWIETDDPERLKKLLNK